MDHISLVPLWEENILVILYTLGIIIIYLVNILVGIYLIFMNCYCSIGNVQRGCYTVKNGVLS